MKDRSEHCLKRLAFTRVPLCTSFYGLPVKNACLPENVDISAPVRIAFFLACRTGLYVGPEKRIVPPPLPRHFLSSPETPIYTSCALFDFFFAPFCICFNPLTSIYFPFLFLPFSFTFSPFFFPLCKLFPYMTFVAISPFSGYPIPYIPVRPAVKIMSFHIIYLASLPAR
jgi:hypothetical protein